MTALLAVLLSASCPASVQTAIRAVPRYAHLASPMSCNFIEITKAGAAGWAFRHGGRHWYVGQAHITCTQRSNPTRCVRYGARVVAFAGHLS